MLAAGGRGLGDARLDPGAAGAKNARGGREPWHRVFSETFLQQQRPYPLCRVPRGRKSVSRFLLPSRDSGLTFSLVPRA